MAIVEITGLHVGFDKVACTQLVKAVAGYGLADAKRVTDGVMGGEVQRIELASDEMAASLVRDLAAIGAVATLVSHEGAP